MTRSTSFFGVEPAEAEPQRRPRLVVAQAKRLQHVRRFGARRGARGAGRNRDIAGERLQQRLAVNAIEC